MADQQNKSPWPCDSKSGVRLDVIAAGFASTHPETMDMIVSRVKAGLHPIDADAIVQSNFDPKGACHRFAETGVGSVSTQQGRRAGVGATPAPAPASKNPGGTIFDHGRPRNAATAASAVAALSPPAAKGGLKMNADGKLAYPDGVLLASEEGRRRCVDTIKIVPSKAVNFLTPKE